MQAESNIIVAFNNEIRVTKIKHMLAAVYCIKFNYSFLENMNLVGSFYVSTTILWTLMEWHIQQGKKSKFEYAFQICWIITNYFGL